MSNPTLGIVVAKSKIEAEVHRLAMEVVEAEVSTGDKYYKLCTFIREHKVLEVTVRREMELVGFRGSRISEVLKVCAADKATWEGYYSRLFSFKRALLLVRTGFTGERVVTPVGELALSSGGGQVSIERAESAESELDGDSGKEKAKPASASQKMARAAAAIFKLAKRGQSWDSGDGWKLMLVKASKKSAKGGEAK